MANVNTTEQEQIRQENIEAKVSATEKFLNENKKTIWCAVAAVVVAGLAVLGYQKFIYGPKCEEAMGAAFVAEQNFQAGEYELALNGDGNVLGIAQVIEEYGKKAGSALYMEAGICELQLGNYESAVSYLRKYNGKEALLAAKALACEGDAQVGLGDYKAAVACYEKAAAKADNIFAAAYLLKAGVAYEALGNKAAALKCYETIKDQYAQSIEGYDIDKYITRAQAE